MSSCQVEHHVDGENRRKNWTIDMKTIAKGRCCHRRESDALSSVKTGL